jgi:hypothetical protein
VISLVGGTFLKIIKEDVFSQTDLNVEKNSVWRGRFILSGNEIKIEEFCPNQAPIKTYDIKVLKGVLKSGTLILDWDEGNFKYTYIKEPLK